MHILYYLRRKNLSLHLVDRTLNLITIQRYLSAPGHTPLKRDRACCNDHGVVDETLTKASSSPTSFHYSIHEDVITYSDCQETPDFVGPEYVTSRPWIRIFSANNAVKEHPLTIGV